ncbi:MAG: YhfC family glutamic-type intramembrane protease [Polyangiaceae bacterium]
MGFFVRAHAPLAVALLALAGCAEKAGAPNAGAFSDGEEAIYASVRADGVVTDYSGRRWQRREEGGLIYREGPASWLTGDGEPQKTIELSPTFDLLAYAKKDGATIHVDGGRATASGPGAPKAFQVPAGALENAVSIEALRAFDLGAPGHQLDLWVVNAPLGVSLPARLRVVGLEKVEVPAGSFDTKHVTVAFGTTAHHAWFDEREPHRMIRYQNASGARVDLVGVRASRAEPAIAQPAAPPSPAPKPTPRWSQIAVALSVQLPLMILSPFVAVFLARRRWSIAMRAVVVGVLSFIGSQVVHLPLNWALGLLGAPRGLGVQPLEGLSVAVGLSAGLCEELARFVSMRQLLPEHRSARDGFAFGLGHGGVEAAIFGLLASAGPLNYVIFHFVPPTVLGVPAAQVGAVYGAAASYWQAPSWVLVSAGVERLSAMSFHVFASLLVMHAVARKNPVFLLLAILLHAATDGAMVYFIATRGSEFGAIGITAMGVVFAAAVVVWMRRAGAPSISK